MQANKDEKLRRFSCYELLPMQIARKWADANGVPLAYIYADNSDLAEVILAFGLLPEREQRRLAVELKARVSPPATKANPVHRTPAARRPR